MPGLIARVLRIGASDPAPFEDAAAFWRVIAQMATIVMAVIMFGAVIVAMASLREHGRPAPSA